MPVTAPVVAIAAAYVLGLAAAALVPESLALGVAFAALGTALALARCPPASTALILVAYFFLGSAAPSLVLRGLLDQPLRKEFLAQGDGDSDTPYLLEGHLESEPERALRSPGVATGRASASFVLNVDTVGAGGIRRATRGRVRLTTSDGGMSAERLDGLGAGDRVQAWARLKAPRGSGSPGRFDVEAYYARRGVALAGSVKSPLVLERVAEARWYSAARWGSRVRAFVRRRLALAFAPGDRGDETAGVLLAMLVGDRAWLPAWADKLYQEAGTLHVIAISGAHVALLGLFVHRFLRFIGLDEVPTLWTLVLLLPAYGFICGGAPSVVRAVVMGLTLVGARLLSLSSGGINALAVSGLVLLVARPLDLADPGFQLSFVATASLLRLGPWLAGLWTRQSVEPVGSLTPLRRRIVCALVRLVAVSISAQAGVLPILAWHFQRLSFAAVLANLIAVPAAAALLVVGAAVVIAEPLPLLGEVTAWLARVLVGLLTISSKGALAAPWGALRVPAPSALWIAGYGLALTVALIARARWRSVALAFLLPWTMWLVLQPDPPPPRELTLTAIDVGHGDALLLEFPRGPRFLIDGGGSFDPDFDVGDAIVVPFLLHRGIRHLDGVVLTHPDRDHWGGLASVLRDLQVDALFVGRLGKSPKCQDLLELSRERGVREHELREGERLSFETGRIDVLSAASPESGSNATSLVLRVVHGRSAVLLTGDAGADVEQKLLASSPATKRELHADVLKVAHHGSRTSSTPQFLDAVSPRVAVISVGTGRPSVLPAPPLLERLESRGIETYRTDRDGTVTVTLSENGEYGVTTYRAARRSTTSFGFLPERLHLGER